MPTKRYSSEQIILKLREAEVLLSQGQTVQQACKTLEISEQTYYRWRREYGGMDTTKVKKLKELEKENTRLKRLVADLSLGSRRRCSQKRFQPGQAAPGSGAGVGGARRVRTACLPGAWTAAGDTAL